MGTEIRYFFGTDRIPTKVPSIDSHKVNRYHISVPERTFVVRQGECSLHESLSLSLSEIRRGEAVARQSVVLNHYVKNSRPSFNAKNGLL